MSDPHKAKAAKIFGVPEDQVTPEQRRYGKQQNYVELYSSPGPMTPIARVMNTFRCSRQDAQRYLDLKDEGYSSYQAALMAGIADPHE